jgi:hypothetical protein
VYPLPPLSPAAFAPLKPLDGALIYAWAPARGRLVRLDVPKAPRTLTVTGPPDGADPAAIPPAASVAVSGASAGRVRLIVLAAGNWDMVEKNAAASGPTVLAVPRAFIEVEGHLYPRRELLWWVVAEDAAGRVVATAEARRLVWR